MAESVEIVYLGWDRSLLSVASEWLADRFFTRELGGGIDLSGIVLVAPGRRFARQLLGKLAEIGEKRKAWVSPGRVITPGEFCGVLLGDREGTTASAVYRAMAWGRALRELHPDKFELILKRRPEDDAASEWFRLGSLMDSTVGELAREMVLPGEVPVRCPSLAAFSQEAKKWEVIEGARVRYLELLKSSGFADAHFSHLSALRESGIFAAPVGGEIVLVGVAELDKASRAAIVRSGRLVHSLVFAPRSSASSLDDLGCVRGEAESRQLPLRGECIEFAEDFEDVATRTIGRIAAWSGEQSKLKAGDVSVCVPDGTLMRELKIASEDIAGLEFHDAAGEPIGARSVVKLLATASEYLRKRTAEPLARIVKRPEVERWVWARIRETREKDLRWVRRVDENGVTNPGAEPDQLGLVTSLAGSFVDELLGINRDNSLIGEHLRAITEMLERAFSGDEIDEREIEALALVGSSMAELQLCEALIGPLPGWRAIELLLVAIEKNVTAEESRRGSVEALGWLEAAVDRAPFMVIAGLNEGMVPRGKVEDSLLPESVRRSLGMPTGETRAARDLYMLEGMLRSREKTGQLWAVVAKADAEGNPLKPSRFVFACEDDEVLARVARLSREVAEPPKYAVDAGAQAADESAAKAAFPLAPLHAMEPPTFVRATAFADYMSSPYVFFLKHVADVKEVQESGGEVDSMGMGVVIHEVLKGLKGSGVEASTKAAAIEEWAIGSLEDQLQRMPAKKLAAVREIQIEVAKRRLRTFARVQANHAAGGWRVVETEWKPDPDVVLEVEEGKVRLLGRFDRIDQRGDEWLVLDYKTGDRGGTPEKKHLRKKEWVNLQLPLYAAIMRMCGKFPGLTRVGYFLLPKKSEDGIISIADWAPLHFEEAEAKAKEIVGAVLRGEFELGDEPHEGGAIARLCGVTLIEIDEEQE